MTLAKRFAVADKLNRVGLYLIREHKACICGDPAERVAFEIVLDAERRARNGFSPVPSQDVDNLLAVERMYIAGLSR